MVELTILQAFCICLLKININTGFCLLVSNKYITFAHNLMMFIYKVLYHGNNERDFPYSDS